MRLDGLEVTQELSAHSQLLCVCHHQNNVFEPAYRVSCQVKTFQDLETLKVFQINEGFPSILLSASS